MHNHNNNNGDGMKSMMWMMVICCAVPLLLILLVGTGGKALGAPSWIIFGGIAVMVIAHFLMMGRSHKNSNEGHSTTEEENKNGKDHSGHGCCH